MNLMLSILAALVLFGCTKESSPPTTQGATEIKEVLPATKTGLLGTVQLKDAETLITFYENVTGVARTNGVIAQEILVTRDFLPLAGKTTDFLAATQRAHISLASAFCAQAVEKQILLPLQGILFVGIDFTKNQAAFSVAFRTEIIRRIAASAWGREATEAEKTELLSALKDFESLPDSPAELKNLVTLLCTSMLAAVDAVRM